MLEVYGILSEEQVCGAVWVKLLQGAVEGRETDRL